jgi:hypothetical protein
MLSVASRTRRVRRRNRSLPADAEVAVLPCRFCSERDKGLAGYRPSDPIHVRRFDDSKGRTRPAVSLGDSVATGIPSSFASTGITYFAAVGRTRLSSRPTRRDETSRQRMPLARAGSSQQGQTSSRSRDTPRGSPCRRRSSQVPNQRSSSLIRIFLRPGAAMLLFDLVVKKVEFASVLSSWYPRVWTVTSRRRTTRAVLLGALPRRRQPA